MYRPIIIDNQGWLSETAGPIRVGAATQPYHAVTLAQVKKLLESGGIASSRSPFVSDLIGNIYDSVCGFCLREIGWFEALDYVYAGRVRSSMQWAATTIMPMVVYVLQDTISLSADTTGFELKEIGWFEELDYVYAGYVGSSMQWSATTLMPLIAYAVHDTITFSADTTVFTLNDSLGDEELDYVYTGAGADTVASNDLARTAALPAIATDTLSLQAFQTLYTLNDTGSTDGNLAYVYTAAGLEEVVFANIPILLPDIVIHEPITVVEVYAPYTLSDTSDSDGTLGYVYSVKGVEPMIATESYFSPELTVVTDTMLLTKTEGGDLMYASLPIDTEELYPSDDIVVQKTKPKPMGEAKTMSDGAYGYVEPKIT
jgi:hypothetical protein